MFSVHFLKASISTLFPTRGITPILQHFSRKSIEYMHKPILYFYFQVTRNTRNLYLFYQSNEYQLNSYFFE